MKLQLSIRARDDLNEIGRFIRARNPAAALAVRAAIRETLDLLTRHPRAGRELRPALFRLVVPRLPYLIFYQVDDMAGLVRVVTIRHASRQEEN